MEAVGGVLSGFGLAASAGLLVLGLAGFFADKIPAVNHANDAIQTFIRPTPSSRDSPKTKTTDI